MELDNSSVNSTQLLNVNELSGIIFDFDGTLVDSEPIWKSVFRDLFFEMYDTELSMEEQWKNTGNGVDKSVTNLAKLYGLDFSASQVADMTSRISEETHRRIIEDLPLRPGAVELFEWARRKNIVMAVCTASTQELISTYLTKHNALQYFAKIISTVDVIFEKRKPHPYPYLTSLEAISVSANRALAIEDSPAGVQSAIAAGIPTIAIHNRFLEERVADVGPMAQLQDFHQVLELLVSES